MRILVQKFGGTSVATPEAREQVYKKILKAKEDGYTVVAVVSAMGRKGDPYATDTLLDLIRRDCPAAQARELDQVFVCGENIGGAVVTANLQQRGHLATYLTGQQAGIITTNQHSDARILKVDTTRILSLLEKNHIVVVAGGQGATADGEITTLGRGGSDTTASALGIALDAESIVIYTDVEGIMSTDPRIISDVKLLKEVTYIQCYEMAYQGAKVIHPRAVKIAFQKPWIKLYIRSTFSENSGTLISSERHHLSMGADISNISKPVGVATINDQIVMKSEKLSSSKRIEILEMIENNGTDSYDIHPESESILVIGKNKDEEKLQKIFDKAEVKVQKFSNLIKVSMVGQNLIRSVKFLAAVLRVLKEEEINVTAMALGPNVISVWVDEEEAVQAVMGIHKLIEMYRVNEIEESDMVEVMV